MADGPRKNVYIPAEFEKIWAEIEKAAEKDKRGTGHFICEWWARTHGKDEVKE